MRVSLSYEEKIINALSRVTHKRGDDRLTRDKRDFDAIRAVLQPLYAERDAERAKLAEAVKLALTSERLLAEEHGRLAEARAMLERFAAPVDMPTLGGLFVEANALLASWDATDAKEKR